MRYEKHIHAMIERLKSRGINDERVLQAMRRVPRHEFVAAGMEFQAYEEKALPIGYGQTISHPYTVAVMTQSLNVQRGERILEIGTGSGYQAAVLCALGAQVFSVEQHKALVRAAEDRLRRLNYHCVLRSGDGSLGWQNFAPFDVIIVTAGAPVVPENLFNQLNNNGKLLIPVGDRENQELILYLKDMNEITKQVIERLKFVPLKGAQGW